MTVDKQTNKKTGKLSPPFIINILVLVILKFRAFFLSFFRQVIGKDAEYYIEEDGNIVPAFYESPKENFGFNLIYPKVITRIYFNRM